MKYLKLQVTRMSSTDLYVSVPDDFDLNLALQDKYCQQLGKIARKTTTDGDWDDHDWEDTIEVQCVGVVTDAEATQFRTGELKP